MSFRIGRLVPEKTALLICDIQERFKPLIHKMPHVIRTAQLMVQSANVLKMPVLVTEQYPKAFGKTVSEISTFLPSTDTHVFEKTLFSMATPEFQSALKSYSNVKSVIIAGLETHVCVLQTALDLLESGYEVHILGDGVSSQDTQDRHYALERLKSSGAFLTTSESALFMLLNSSQNPSFKAISNLVKDYKADIRKHPEDLLP
eukprot:TRINITY_DN1046_c0_g2_i3.p1 TRINITY_DN1046_c0_g2~~TRINITY_DN1046_c0_g2_i3.p1  ORF type:complete len:203 (+),score=41.04 TRINITY_DN1046_c0_g2_i3:200-808(+)